MPHDVDSGGDFDSGGEFLPPDLSEETADPTTEDREDDPTPGEVGEDDPIGGAPDPSGDGIIADRDDDGGGGGGGGGGSGGGGTTTSPEPAPPEPEPAPSPAPRRDAVEPETIPFGLEAGGGVVATREITGQDILDYPDLARDVYGDDIVEQVRSQRRAAISRSVRRDQDVAGFDPAEDIERVGEASYRAEYRTDEGTLSERFFGFTPLGVREAREAQRAAARRGLEQRLEKQVGRDLDPGEDITYTETGEGTLTAELAPGVQRDLLLTRLESRVGRDLDPSEVTFEETEQGLRARLTSITQQSVTGASGVGGAAFLQARGGGGRAPVAGRSPPVEVTEEGFIVTTTEEGLRRSMGSDVQLERRVPLTEEGFIVRETPTGRRVSRGSIGVEDPYFGASVIRTDPTLSRGQTIAGLSTRPGRGASGPPLEDVLGGYGEDVSGFIDRQALAVEGFIEEPDVVADPRSLPGARAAARAGVDVGPRTLVDADPVVLANPNLAIGQEIAGVSTKPGDRRVDVQGYGGTIVDRPEPGPSTGVARSVGGGVRSAEILNLPRTALVVKEGVEYAGAGIRELGEGAEATVEFGERSLDRGVELGEEAVAYAVRNPARTGGALAGSLLLSGALIAGAPGVAGRGVAAAIQPGEELAKAGARAGLYSPRAARLVPGVRRGQFETETPGSGGLDVGSRASRVAAGARERVGAARARGPSVSVESRREFGLGFEIDERLTQSLRSRAARTRVRAGERVQAVDASVRDLGAGLARTPERVRSRFSRSPGRIEFVETETGNFQAFRVPPRSRVRGGIESLRQEGLRARRRLGSVPGELRFGLEAGVTRARELPGDLAAGARGRLPSFDGDGLEFDVGRPFRQAGQRLSLAEARARARIGRARTLPGEARFRVEDTLARAGERAEDIGFRAGVRVGRGLSTRPGEFRYGLGDLRARIGAAPGALRSRLPSRPTTGDLDLDLEFDVGRPFRQLGDRAEGFGFRAGYRVGRVSRTLPGEARYAIGRVGERSLEGIARAWRPAGDVGEAFGAALAAPFAAAGRARRTRVPRGFDVRIEPGRDPLAGRELPASVFASARFEAPDRIDDDLRFGLEAARSRDFDILEAFRREGRLEAERPGRVRLRSGRSELLARTRRERRGLAGEREARGPLAFEVAERIQRLETQGLGRGVDAFDAVSPEIDVAEATAPSVSGERAGPGRRDLDFTEPVADVELGVRGGVAGGLEQRGGLELVGERVREAEVEREVRREMVAEVVTGLELETPREFILPNPEEQALGPARRVRGDRGVTGRGPSRDPFLAPGWFSQTVRDWAVGTGLEAERAPTYEELAELIETPRGRSGEFPTYEELSGTREERAAIQETREFITPGPDTTPRSTIFDTETPGSTRENPPPEFDAFEWDTGIDTGGAEDWGFDLDFDVPVDEGDWESDLL